MCSRTPIWCPTCGGTLLWATYGTAECHGGHRVAVTDLPLGDGQRIVTQSHAAGRSLIQAHTECARCAPQ